MKFFFAVIAALAATTSAISPEKLAHDVQKLVQDVEAREGLSSSTASFLSTEDNAQTKICRSTESEGVCRPDCGSSSVVENPERLSCGKGTLCCEVEEEDSFDASMETDADGGYEPEGVADFDPEAGAGDSETEGRHSNFLGQEKCYGDQEPHDCGAAYRRGRKLGNKMCVRMRGQVIVEEMACRLEEMLKDAEAAGNHVLVTSGFRTHAKQAQLRRLYCSRGNCGRAAPAGYSNHQNGIAVDIACRTNPRLYSWLKANAHRYEFVRTVRSEEWHWEHRPGVACDAFVKTERATGRKYQCVNAGDYQRRNAGELKQCKNHSELSCVWGKSNCGGDGEYHSGECSGDTWCCKDFEKPEAPPMPACKSYPELQCLPGKSSCRHGYHSGQCAGDSWCCKPEPELVACDDHPNLKCKHGRSSCGSAGYFSGQCRGDTWCCKE